MTDIDLFDEVQTAIRLARRQNADAARIARLRQLALAAGLASGGIVLVAAVLLVRLV